MGKNSNEKSACVSGVHTEITHDRKMKLVAEKESMCVYLFLC